MLKTKQFQPITKRATRGERVLGSLIPSRGLGYPGGWSQDRIEQVLHMKNWTYIAIDALACLIAQLVPNMAYVSYSQKPKEIKKNRVSQSIWRDRTLTLPEKWAAPTDVNTSRFSIPGYYAKALSVIKPHEELEPLEWDHPLRRLIENPNPVDTSFDLLYELDMFLELCGVAYLWAVPSGLVNPVTGSLIPAELWVIPSHWVWPRTGGQRSEYVSPEHPFADRLIEYYEIRPWGMMGSSGVLRFPPNEVLMFNWKSPLNKIDGYSKLAAIASWIDTEESIGKSRWSQMMNQARSEVHIEMPADFEDPDDNRIARIEAKFMAKYQGEYNYGKPMFTPAGVKVTPLSFSPTEMAYFQCCDTETECLTSDGWKKYTELDEQSSIACYNDKTGKLEYHQPSRVMVSDYKGPMHQWKSQDVDILVTPGHRMLTLPLNKAGQTITNSDWSIDRIRDLSPNREYRIKTTAPVETSQPEFIEIPMFKKYAKGEPAMVGKYQIAVGDWAKFLGWYVSEGHVSKRHDTGFNDAGKRRRRHRITISQHKQSNYTPVIDKMLTSIPPYDWTKWPCGGMDNKSCWQWNGTDRGIYLHLREHCGATAKEKKLPRYVMQWSAETLQVLLDAAIAGDGKGPVKNKRSYQSWYYRTTSLQLADDIAEIGVKCGYTTSVTATQYPYKGKMHGYYTVHLRDRSYANVHVRHQSVVNYDGKIWCVTVPTGLFVVRRNGKTHITGNSEEQIRDMILSAFRVPGAAVGLVREMTYGSILATLAQMCSFAVNPRLAMLGQRFTKFLAARFGDDVRVWWDDCTPPDPQQVNADVGLDFSCMAISPNEIRALRGRKPWQHGGDDPMGPGPGGTVPIPLNTGDDLTELAELVPNLGAGGQEEQPGGPGGPMGGGPGGQPPAGGLELPKPDNETDGLLNEKPVMNPGIEEPNSSPTKGKAIAKRRKSIVQKKEGLFKFASTQFNLADAQAEQLYGEPLWKRILSMASSIDESDLAEDGRESTPHVTVKYGLHTANPEELTQIVRGFGPVRMRLGKTSVFPANQSNAQRGKPLYDVVKIDVVSPDLKRLNKLIADYIDHTDTHPVYQPHITLAYVKPGMGPMYAGMVDVNGAWVVCDKLLLTDKDGAVSKISLVNRTKRLVGKDKGQPCEQGETAARSGCVPSDGSSTGGGGRKTPPPLPGKKSSVKQALADIGSKSFEALAKIGGTFKHWEHVAKDWVSSGVEQNVSKLPNQMQNVVKGCWAALRLGGKGAFATYTAGQKMAEEVALAKGMSPEAASNLRSVLSTIDIATFKPVSVGVAAIAGPAVAGAASFIPIGSLTYLAYSTATNPMAVAMASKNLIKKAAKRLGVVKGEAGSGLVGRVADFVGEDDQRLSLLLAALDEMGSLSKALRLARYAADSGKAKQHGGKWVEAKSKRCKLVDKDKGQPCEQGETAARSGCIPADGSTGNSQGSQGSAQAQTTDNKVEPLRADDAKYMAEMCKALFDHDDPNAFASLAGVTGAEVLVGKFRDPDSYNPGVNVVVKHPAFISLQYQAWVDGDGNKRFHLDEFFLEENQKGTGAATATFANQVNSLRENGFATMDCLAAQGPDTLGNPMNGYYTWPRFGFDFPLKELDRDVWKAAEDEFPLAESVLDLMQTEKGRAWWKENGVALNGAMFDLSEGSRSLQIWDAYMEERAKGKPKTKSKKMKKAQEPDQKPEKEKTKIVEMDLAPWEEEALERAWKKIEQQNKTEEE